MRFGIDLGGTKIEILALDAQNRIVLRRRVPTPKGDYQACIKTMTQLVNQAESELGVKATVGFGIPGAISAKTGLVKNANSTWLIGQNLKGDLEQALQREVRIANDANCFALSEASQGSGQCFDSVFGVIIGTGCGGGLVYKGQIIEGANAIAGEWGHNPLPWQDSKDQEQIGRASCRERV